MPGCESSYYFIDFTLIDYKIAWHESHLGIDFDYFI